MKIELYFDLVKPSTLEALKNFKDALSMFNYRNDLEIVYKSYLSDSKLNHLEIHALIQYVKRKVNTLDLVIDALEAIVLEHLSENKVLEKCVQMYKLNMHEVEEALESGKYHKIVNHHMEHAVVKGVKDTPYVIFENKETLVGLKTKSQYYQALIDLYEYESKQEYCVDDDCKRV